MKYILISSFAVLFSVFAEGASVVFSPITSEVSPGDTFEFRIQATALFRFDGSNDTIRFYHIWGDADTTGITYTSFTRISPLTGTGGVTSIVGYDILEVAGGHFQGSLGPDVTLAIIAGIVPSSLLPGDTFSIGATNDSFYSDFNFAGTIFTSITRANFIVVPEPTSLVLLLLSIPLLGFRRRTKRTARLSNRP